MQYKTIILDRDGVINEVNKNYIKSVAELNFISGSIDAINRLLLNNTNVVVASNQSCVGRGIITQKDLNSITDYINSRLAKKIDFFYCTHSPKKKCKCRKPNPGLINQIKLKNIGPYLFVGDNISDFEASQSACIDFALVRTGYGNEFMDKLTKKCKIYNNLNDLVQSSKI